MSDDRAAILDRVRAALHVAYLPDARDALSPAWPPTTEEPAAARAAQFAAALEAVGGEVVRVAGATEAQSALVALLRAANATEVLAWSDDELPVPVAGALAAAGIATQPAPALAVEPDARLAQLAAVDSVTVGVTGAAAGLADTGTLALLSGARRPMLPSLLPLIHIALLREADIVPDLATFLARHPAAAQTATSRNLVFITGPSRTADIEMIITRGVHGPRRVVVVMVGDG